MKKILLIIFTALFFVLPTDIVASQKSNPLIDLQEGQKERSALERIPEAVFSNVCEFIGPVPHEKYEIEYRPEGFCFGKWEDGKIWIPYKFQQRYLRKMVPTFRSIAASVQYYLNLLKTRTKQLEVVVCSINKYLNQEEQPVHYSTLSDSEVKNSKKIQDYKKNCCPSAEVVLSRRPDKHDFFPLKEFWPSFRGEEVNPEEDPVIDRTLFSGIDNIYDDWEIYVWCKEKGLPALYQKWKKLENQGKLEQALKLEKKITELYQILT